MPKTKGMPSPSHYFYPSTNTLKNKYGIQDPGALMEVYARNVEEGIARLREEPSPQFFDLPYLRHIHRALFFNTFEWAGRLRNEPFTFEDGTTAAMPEMMDSEWGNAYATGDQIQENLTAMSRKLYDKNHLKGLSREEFVEESASLFALLHFTCPFRVGNNITEQLFFENLAREAGHLLDFSLVKQEDISLAYLKAEEKNSLEPLKNLFEHISNPQHVSKKQNLAETQQKGHVSSEQQKTLKNEGEAVSTPQRTEQFSEVLIPAKFPRPMQEIHESMRREIDARIKGDSNLCESREQIEILSKLVYGKSKILDKQMMQISGNLTNPSSTAYKLSRQIKRDPSSLGRLAGINFCGLKNAKRKTAERNLKELADEIVNYSLIVGHIQKEITQSYQNERARCLTEVKMPSENLQMLLIAPKEMQKQALEQSPALSKEFDAFVTALNNRISPNEQKKIDGGDHEDLARLMIITRKEAQRIIDVTRLTKAVQTPKTEQSSDVPIPAQSPRPTQEVDESIQKEIKARIKEDSDVCKSQEEIRRLSKLVYGKSKILNKEMMQISTNLTNPSSIAYKLSRQLKRDPSSIGGFTGIDFCGLKNARRKTAEGSVKALADEIVNFSLNVERVQKGVIQGCQNEQMHCATGIEMPTGNSQDLLALSKEMQKQASEKSPALSEGFNFMKELNNLPFPDEQGTIKEMDPELAAMIGLSEEKLRRIADVAQSANAEHPNSETQTRAKKSSKGLAIAS